VAGVINIISDRRRCTDGDGHAGAAAVSTASNASFIASVSNENKLALSMGGHRQSSDRAPLHKYYPADFPKVDAGAIPAAEREDYVGNIDSHSLFARLDVGDDLSFGYYRNHFRSLTSTGDTPATALYREDAFWDTTTDTLYGKYRFKLAENLGGELVVDYSVQEIDPDSKYININTGFADSYEYAHGERLSIEQNLNWQLNPNHRILAGLGYQDYSAIEGHSLSRPYDTGRGPDDQGPCSTATPRCRSVSTTPISTTCRFTASGRRNGCRSFPPWRASAMTAIPISAAATTCAWAPSGTRVTITS
jgi:outer membrane receptor for ferrienterochelin and colicins